MRIVRRIASLNGNVAFDIRAMVADCRTTGVTAPRRWASAEYAGLKVKKNNYVEVGFPMASYDIFTLYCAVCNRWVESFTSLQLMCKTIHLRVLYRLQMNEVRRENKFSTYVPNKSNIVGLIVALVAFPLAFHSLTKEEAERRARVMGSPDKPFASTRTIL